MRLHAVTDTRGQPVDIMQGGEVVHVARPPLFEPLMAGPRQQQHQQTGGFLPQANALPCGQNRRRCRCSTSAPSNLTGP